MLPKPAVIFPDAKAWAVAYVNAALLARPIGDTYADAVTVAGRVPDTMPTRLVTIRDDGGTRALVTKSVSLGVNVWAETEQVCSQLAALVVAILEASPGQGRISNESPVGRALLGKKKGDKVTISVPAGDMHYKVVSIS